MFELYESDCVKKLKELKSSTFQLIYLDPPFFTQKRHALSPRDEEIEYSFSDLWASLNDYLFFMREVLQECRRVLKDQGSIFLHCDKSASHHLRVLLEQIFGEDNFQSEIVWAYKRWSNSKKGLLNSHQIIYFYSNGIDFKFNPIFVDYSPTTNIDQILQSRARNGLGKSAYKRDENGDTVLGEEKKGVPLSDVWNIPFLNPKAKERVGYPTQKPIILLEQIIKIATDPGDWILDPFCGSGTTLVAANLLERNSVGIDISPEAIELSQNRANEPLKSESAVYINGEETFLNKTNYERNLLAALDAIPVERNNGIDGFLRNYLDGFPVAVRIQKPDEDIETAQRKLLSAGKSKHCRKLILIRTNRVNNSFFLGNPIDDSILILDSYDLTISDWVQKNPNEPDLSFKTVDSIHVNDFGG
jgi:site-specific DNA-methyltransferase (adenine-specific)